jgi:cytochrome c oxidase subunit 3
MSGTHGNLAVRYFIPQPSNWPAVGMLAMLLTTFGAALLVNHNDLGALLLLAGFAILVVMLYGWFGTVFAESETGHYGLQVDGSFRWGMSWFIFSEIMFFASFFGALFYARNISMPALGDFDSRVLWPDFAATWPNAGPAGTVEPFAKIHPWPVPTINTILLVSSGFTLTVAHHALRENLRNKAISWLVLTLLLGFSFVAVQAFEYHEAYSDLNLKLSSGVFGSTFFMLTGFHGCHVLIGAIMLTVVAARLFRGDFKPDHHFAFEAASWYWHFVDVIWLGLYLVVYWL